MTRRDLALRFAALGFTTGAEIGVEQGRYSSILCDCIPGLQLLAVDAWTAYPGYRDHVDQAKLDAFEVRTRRRLAPYGAEVVKGWSTNVARTVPDGSYDFVFLDANHTYAHISADIAAWAPKVRRGGIVSGHDFNLPDVARAVREAAEAEVSLTDERSPSWWWVRP